MVKDLGWSVKQMSILLTIIALALWCYSITAAKLNIGFYGLIHSFPISFFIALGILTIASAILWTSKKNHQKLLFFQLLFLITALWVTPALIGSPPISNTSPLSQGRTTSLLLLIVHLPILIAQPRGKSILFTFTSLPFPPDTPFLQQLCLS